MMWLFFVKFCFVIVLIFIGVLRWGVLVGEFEVERVFILEFSCEEMNWVIVVRVMGYFLFFLGSVGFLYRYVVVFIIVDIEVLLVMLNICLSFGKFVVVREGRLLVIMWGRKGCVGIGLWRFFDSCILLLMKRFFLRKKLNWKLLMVLIVEVWGVVLIFLRL